MTYKTSVTIRAQNDVILTGLPFRPGEEVEIVVYSKADRASRVRALRDLLARTQALPQAREISQAEIEEEIEAYRAGR